MWDRFAEKPRSPAANMKPMWSKACQAEICLIFKCIADDARFEMLLISAPILA